MQQQRQKRKPYPSDLTPQQFRLVEPLIKRKRRKTGRPPAGLFEIINGMLYVLSTGCRRRDLPHDFNVHCTTGYRYFIKWVKDGTLRDCRQFSKMIDTKNTHLMV